MSSASVKPMPKRKRPTEAELRRQQEIDDALEQMRDWSRRAKETIRQLEKVERWLREQYGIPA